MDWTREQAVATGGQRAAEVYDALIGREIRVTKQHIWDGNKEDCRSCPVALAVLEVMPGAHVYADYEYIEVDRCIRFATTPEVEEFMRRFDRRKRRWLSGVRFALTELLPFHYFSKEQSQCNP